MLHTSLSQSRGTLSVAARNLLL
uniref:Uncharacterized protein n=1 Tax=Anguilla anguilla TaxID=7936 RepID=A0A0E9PGQ4_ANGAN